MTFPTEFIGADDFGETIRDTVNQQLSMGGKFRAVGESGGSPSAVSVADSTWVDLPVITLVPATTDLGATLVSGEIDIPAANSGILHAIGRCTWKNDHAALAKHRRRIRIMGGGGFGDGPIVEGPELLFDPAMGDLSTPSVQGLSNYWSHPAFLLNTYRLQVWQNSGDTVDVLTHQLYIVRAGDI